MYSLNDLCSNLIPSGRVKAQVTDIKFKAGATGEASNDIVVNWTIVEGPAAKRTLVETFYEKAASFKLKPFLTACKVDMTRQFATKEEVYNFALKEAKGKIVMIDVNIKTYNGKEYNEITGYTPLPDSKTTADEALEEFDIAPEAKTETPVEAAVATPAATDEMPELDVIDDESPF